MKNSAVIFLIVLVAGAFYFLGKKNGAAATKISIVQNTDMIRLIAELAALDVTGNVNLKISNKTEGAGTWTAFKNYFTENTLKVSIPFEAKYGVNLSNQKMNVNTKAAEVLVYLPHCKLMSLQLKMDSIETMSQTGIFMRSSADDLVSAQKLLYKESLQKLEKDSAYILLAEKHVSDVFNNYYKPLGYTVKCIFSERRDTLLQY